MVTATGLKLQFMSGMDLTVDGRRIEPGKAMTYKAMMLCGVPNLVCTFGYTNASWTLKADLTAEYACRLLCHMRDTGARKATPRHADASVEEIPFLDFSSGYVQRAISGFPSRAPNAPGSSTRTTCSISSTCASAT